MTQPVQPQPDSAATSATSAADLQAVLKQFRLIYGNARQHYREMETASGLGGAQIWALGLVSRQAGIRVSDLAEAMSVHQTTASNLVAGLVRKGLLRRERNAQDQRVVRLYATEHAAELLLRAPGPVEGVLLQGLRHLSNEQLSTLNVVLQQLLDRMQSRQPDAANIPLADL